MQFDAIVAELSQVLWCSSCVLFNSIMQCAIESYIIGVHLCIMIVLHAEISIPYSMVENAPTVSQVLPAGRVGASPFAKLPSEWGR